jgi:hypothetical protein
MTYYKSNALYEKIKEMGLTHFKFVSGDAWQLIYGDEASNPLLLVFAKGTVLVEYNEKLSEQDEDAINLLSYVSDRTGLPLIIIKFRTDLATIQEVSFAYSDLKFQKISLKSLTALYGKYGLPVSNTPTDKYLNDTTSSAYHNWQRQNLGRDLTVSDIDLWRIDEDEKPEIIFELKRSYYSLERWKPFTDDYNNFRLISNLCNKASLNFKIAYNVRTKNPFHDDISKIKLFEVNFNKKPPIKEEGIISLKEFLL